MGICFSSEPPASYVIEAPGGSNIFADIVSEKNSFGSLCSRIGAKEINQDSAVICQMYGVEDAILASVFDGHGHYGHEVSQLVRTRFPAILANQKNLLGKRHGATKKSFVKAFEVMDKEIKVKQNLDSTSSGTTASVVIKQGERLVIANLGDSRVVLGTMTQNGIKAVPLTTDMKPSLPVEADRIRKKKGRVLALVSEPHIQRVWLPDKDVPGLAMSRAFGNFQLKDHGVIALPEVSFHTVSPNDQFVILATDGIWDVLSNDEAVAIVWATVNKEDASTALVGAAQDAWKSRFPSSTMDDCSVICLTLQTTI